MKTSFWRTVSQIVFLALFTFLVVQGRVQAWIILLIAGALISVFAGRIYCGWACPMGSLMRLQSFIYEKLPISRIKAPKFLNNKFVRTLMVVAFFGGMVLVRRFGVKLNIIVYLVVLGVGLSFIFTEELCHRICPHGTVLNIVGRLAPVGMKINTSDCTACGLCQKVCPNDAISGQGSEVRTIDSNECLACFECQKACPTDAVKNN